jgi:tetratricopeptide (TPR) repeat protein
LRRPHHARHGGPAQSAAALEAERAAVFARMLDAPADRALMAQYARLSIQLSDYEAAAATLERLIDLEPANATARLELATAYFAMGNYPLAEFHLNAATASGALTPEQLASAEAYRGAAAGTGRAQPVFGLRRGGDRFGRWRDRRSGHRRADMVAGPGRRERHPVGHPDRAQHLPA